METIFIKNLNINEAGFHLLMLLSFADNKSPWVEREILIDFLNKNYDDKINIIKEQAFLNALPLSYRKDHFIEVATHFYKISKIEQRYKFTGFAIKIVMADNIVEKAENEYINILYDLWDLE
jgi:hypothetical protein